MSKSYQLDAQSKENLDELITSVKYKPLVPFLGAGVNSEYIHPRFLNWNKLLNDILEYAILNYSIKEDLSTDAKEEVVDYLKKDESNLYYKATMLKTMVGRHYIPIIQKLLYSKYEISKAKTINEENTNDEVNENGKYSAYLPLIAELCNKNTIAAITYNYDTFLEDAINVYNGNEEKAFNVNNNNGKVINGGFPIYHVHGYIQPPYEIISNKNVGIVLSYDEYFQNMLHTHSWQTTSQIHFLSNYTCLFLGASLEDWNMLRLINSVTTYSNNPNIYVLYKAEDPSHIQKLKTTTLKEIGIKTIFCKCDNYTNLYKFFKKELVDSL